MTMQNNGETDLEIISKLRAAQIELLLIEQEEVNASDLRRIIERLQEIILKIASPLA
jgi:hypothetical protein